MIQRYYDGYLLVCDVCGERAEPDFDAFDDAVDFKIDHGWKSQKQHGEWEDVCPDCQGNLK